MKYIILYSHIGTKGVARNVSQHGK